MLKGGFSSDEAQKLYALVDLDYTCTDIIRALGVYKRGHSLIETSKNISDCFQVLNDKKTNEAIGQSVNPDQYNEFPLLLKCINEGI